MDGAHNLRLVSSLACTDLVSHPTIGISQKNKSRNGLVFVFIIVTILGNIGSKSLQQQQQQRVPWERPGPRSFCLPSCALCLAWKLLVCFGISTPTPTEPPTHTVDDSYKYPPGRQFLARATVSLRLPTGFFPLDRDYVAVFLVPSQIR